VFLEFVHNDVTHFLEFNKNNTEFLTGSLDGNILVWKINDEIISKMRKGLQTTNKNDKDYIYPVFVSKKIQPTPFSFSKLNFKRSRANKRHCNSPSEMSLKTLKELAKVEKSK
jgi:WD40 repeat protein